MPHPNGCCLRDIYGSLSSFYLKSLELTFVRESDEAESYDNIRKHNEKRKSKPKFPS